MSIGERIVELREAAGLSQYQLAKIMEVSRQAVSKWETDQSVPDARKLIRLAEVLETDIEYLSTGRRNYGRRPPVLLRTVQTVEVEKIVEKPVIQVVEKVVEKIVEQPVTEYTEYIEKPVIKKVVRVKYRRNFVEFAVVGVICFLLGFFVGSFL